MVFHIFSNVPYSAVNVNENNVRSDLPDIFKRNHDIRLTVQKTQEPVAPGHHNLADTAAAGVELQVAHSPQFPAILHINHVFIFEFGKKHLKKSPNLFACY